MTAQRKATIRILLEHEERPTIFGGYIFSREMHLSRDGNRHIVPQLRPAD